MARREKLESTDPPDDPGFIQIVLGHFHFNPVTGGKAHKFFAHFTGDGGQNLMFVIQLDAKHGPSQYGENSPFNFNMLFHFCFK